jgi:hypothetical protein
MIDLIDPLVLTFAAAGDRDHMSFPVHKDIIPVDPSSFDEVHIIIVHKGICSAYQLKVGQIGKKVGLYDSYTFRHTAYCISDSK